MLSNPSTFVRLEWARKDRVLSVIIVHTTMAIIHGVPYIEMVQVGPKSPMASEGLSQIKRNRGFGGLSIYLQTDERTSLVQAANPDSPTHRACHLSNIDFLAFTEPTTHPTLTVWPPS